VSFTDRRELVPHGFIWLRAIHLRRFVLGAAAASLLLLPGVAPAQTASAGAAPPAGSNAINNHLSPCWKTDNATPSVSPFSVHLLVTTDATGTVRDAQVAPQDLGRMSDPAYAAYANRAIHAVMDYRCATLPLPSYMLGQNQTFIFDFSP
jgi:hypothetical protein